MEFGPIFRAMTRHRARFVLIVLEVALTLAIVTNCVGLILEARAKMTRASGFDEQNLVLVNSTPFSDAFRDPAYLRQSVEEDLRVLRALPGVRAATHATLMPWSSGGTIFGASVSGTERDAISTQFFLADPGLLDTLGVKIVQGRNLTREEYDGTPADTHVTEYEGGVLVSEKLAEAMFPGGNAAGKVFRTSDGQGSFTIVGVFDPFFKPEGGGGESATAEYATIFPIQAASFEGGARFLLRAEPDQVGVLAAEAEKALLASNAGRNIVTRTIPEMRKRYHAEDRILITSLNAVMALLLAVTALGIVGLTSFSVSERRRQIGTRRALGATQADILRHFLLENWMVTTFGAVLGLALAYGLNYGLVTWAEGARLDPRMLATGVAALWALGLTAALGPALRAAKVPPAIATRNV